MAHWEASAHMTESRPAPWQSRPGLIEGYSVDRLRLGTVADESLLRSGEAIVTRCTHRAKVPKTPSADVCRLGP